MTDYSTATDEELEVMQEEVQLELQERNTKQRLLDAAWELVIDAKNAGYTKGQVGNQLQGVLDQAY